MAGGEYFQSKTGVGHGIGHLDAILGVGRVVCIKHRDFRKTNRNTNHVSAVMSVWQFLMYQRYILAYVSNTCIGHL